MSRSLTDVGHVVTTAFNGMDVERYCLDDQCDVVLVEEGLTYLSGVELLEAVNSAKASVEIIMLVKSNSSVGIGEFLKRGAFDALVVPDEVVSQHRVVSLVRHALEISPLEKKQSQSKKMETLGRITGGVAHDFNNLLTSVMGHAHLLRQEVSAGTPAQTYVKQINDTCKRAAALIHELLVVEKNQTVKLERMEIGKVIDALGPTLNRLLSDGIELTYELEATENHVLIDRLHLEQVLSNLVVNARDAMPAGGQLVIHTHTLEIGKNEARSLGVVSGHFVRLDVKDTGTGMEESVKERIFEPFFTTKPVSRGTGLGLATVKRIISQSGGAISVNSTIGLGTTFSVFLPVLKTRRDADPTTADVSNVDNPLSFDKTAAPGPPAPMGDLFSTSPEADVGFQASHRTVLVVDDEADLRNALRSGLEQSGYTVLEASNGVKGLACLDQSGGGVDLVVSDLVMPVMNGVEFAERVRDTYPQVKVMFISGAANMSLLDDSTFNTSIPLLEKPFQLTTLVRQVSDLLAPTG